MDLQVKTDGEFSKTLLLPVMYFLLVQRQQQIMTLIILLHGSGQDVPGLQKFGQFEGNGNDNGPFIELGFRPALLIFLKCDDNSGDNYDWRIIDSEREKFNDGSGSRYLIPQN